jgi:hypothetical protein
MVWRFDLMRIFSNLIDAFFIYSCLYEGNLTPDLYIPWTNLCQFLLSSCNNTYTACSRCPWEWTKNQFKVLLTYRLLGWVRHTIQFQVIFNVILVYGCFLKKVICVSCLFGSNPSWMVLTVASLPNAVQVSKLPWRPASPTSQKYCSYVSLKKLGFTSESKQYDVCLFLSSWECFSLLSADHVLS